MQGIKHNDTIRSLEEIEKDSRGVLRRVLKNECGRHVANTGRLRLPLGLHGLGFSLGFVLLVGATGGSRNLGCFLNRGLYSVLSKMRGVQINTTQRENWDIIHKGKGRSFTLRSV